MQTDIILPQKEREMQLSQSGFMNKAQIILHYLGHGDSHSSHSCAAAENILLILAFILIFLCVVPYILWIYLATTDKANLVLAIYLILFSVSICILLLQLDWTIFKGVIALFGLENFIKKFLCRALP
jgi:hypothetical protein